MINWKSIEFLEDYNEELLTENLMLHLKIEKVIECIKNHKVGSYTAEEQKILNILGVKDEEEIPEFRGTLEELDSLTITGGKN